MALYRHTDGKLLYIDNKLAHNANCCCGDTYVGCYCPTSIPVCIANLTDEEIAALNYFPEKFENSQNKTCLDSENNNLYRCVGFSNPAVYYQSCLDEIICGPSGGLVFTSTTTSTDPNTLNCNQYINFGQNGLGICKGYSIPGNTFLGQFCSITEAECSSYIDDNTSVVWTAGTCEEIYSVQVSNTVDPTTTFEYICGNRNCCDSDNCDNPKFCACNEWRIIEVGFGVQYQYSTTLCNIPATYTPPYFAYNGYMQLQFRCNGASWVTKESWTTNSGSPTHTFAIYDSNCVDCVNLQDVEIEYGAKL